MNSLESASAAAFPYLVAGLVLSPLGLVVDTSGRLLSVVTIHLLLLVGFGLVVVLRVAPMATGEWFAGTGMSHQVRLIASGVATIVLSTGVVALVTLASSAALRFDPSLQFLQLLSALDIAWVVAAIVIGTQRGWGTRTGVVAGSAIGLFCVWSIWNYLRTVGFGPDGEWIVDAGQLMRLVLPFDMLAAVLAVGVFLVGTRRAPQTIEQLSAQS